MALLFTLPRSIQSDAFGQLMSGWTVEFYATGTSTPQTVYADAALTVPLGASVPADDDGSLRPIYLDDLGPAYKILIKNSGGEIVPNGTIDPYLLGPSQNQIGRTLYPRTSVESAAGVTPVNYAYPEGSLLRYGAVGNGVVADDAAVSAALSVGLVDLAGDNYVYRITTTKTVSVAGTKISGRGGKLLFAGANTQRILNVDVADFYCTNVVFDGNNLQPNYALVRIENNAARPVFRDCVFQNMLGTSVLASTPLNQMYALMISPYGVSDLVIDGCIFRDIYKHNDTATIGTPTIGLGFCGGIAFGREDSDLSASQTLATSGSINDCSFINIQTILDESLSESDQLNFDDADGIRFISSLDVELQVPVVMRNLRFVDVSKRAIKIATNISGPHIDGVHVTATTDLAYGMASIVRLSNDCFARNIRGVASTTRRFNVAVQVHGYKNCFIDGVNVSHCVNGFELTPQGTGSLFVRSIELRNAIFSNVTGTGYNQNATGATQENIIVDNVRVIGSGTTARGFHNLYGDSDGNGEHKFRNCQAVNCDVKIEGNNNEVTNMLVHISSGTYAGSSSDRALVEIGRGTGVSGNNVTSGLRVYAPGISTTYTNSTRTRLLLFYGDASIIDGVSVTVPDGMNVTYPTIDFGGDDCLVQNVELRGPGFIKFGVFEAAVRSVLRNATRLGNGATSSHFVEIGVAGSDDLVLENIIDMRPTSGVSVLVNNAGGAYLIHGIQTRSSGGAYSDLGTKATVIDTQTV